MENGPSCTNIHSFRTTIRFRLSHLILAPFSIVLLLVTCGLTAQPAKSLNPKLEGTTQLRDPSFKLKPFVLSERSIYYHNTLEVDLFKPEDFKKDVFFPKGATLTEKDFLRKRIFEAERIWEKETKPTFDSNSTDWFKIQPTFQCPHLVENFGDGCFCGLSEYRDHPRPQECVVYLFCGKIYCTNTNLEGIVGTTLNQTGCFMLVFETNGGKVDTSKIKINSSKFEVIKDFDLKQKLKSSKNKVFRDVLKENGHGWVDMLYLLLDNGDEIPLLDGMIDFYRGLEYTLPFAQLNVHFNVNSSSISSQPQQKNKEGSIDFATLYKKMLEHRLRPICGKREESNVENEVNATTSEPGSVKNATVDGDSKISYLLKYTFINLRGKHLIISGNKE